MSTSNVWQDNTIQFPRLLAEIMATQSLDMPALAESMDLSIEQLNELFDRADAAWESAKYPPNAPISTVSHAAVGDDLAEAKAVLGSLLAWARTMGGWDAPCWQEAERFLRK